MALQQRAGSPHLDAGLVEQRYELPQGPATKSGTTTLERFGLHLLSRITLR